MRILLVGFFFPPYNQIGGLRAGKFAKYLLRAGHDVRVLCANRPPVPVGAPLEIPASSVIATPWLNVNALPEWLLGGRARVVSQGYRRPGIIGRLLAALGKFYAALLNIPDGNVGWLPYAVAAGDRLIANWRPDVIVGATPPTGLLIAARLARKHRVPWVADMRDLWTDSHLGPRGDLRRRLDTWLERRVLGSAKGFVTVSEPLARKLASKYSSPVKIIFNGFDPEDMPPLDEARASRSDGKLHIVYTGMVYGGHQDPAPLFQALRDHANLRGAFRIDFYGRNLSAIADAAAFFGLDGVVRTHAPVSYREALRLQQQADALLFLVWNDGEAGVMTGKLFEYLGARRPILMIGPEEDGAVRLTRERRAGVFCRSAVEVAAQLSEWKRQKASGDRLPNAPADALTGHTRAEQAQALAEFLQACCLNNV